MPLRLHIGFDFWGAGNLGDDLMLDGFLGWLEQKAPATRVSALCAHNIAAMQLRFPRVNWCPPGSESAREALAQADAWIGLGGSPFQSDLGPWLLDQMCTGMEEAARLGIPTFLVGVGLNNREAFQSAKAHRAAQLAQRIWVRDASCLGSALRGGLSPMHTRQGADLAHLSCARLTPTRRTGHAALLIHEPMSGLSSDAIKQLLSTEPFAWAWLCQESRPLENSESVLHDQLPPSLQASMPRLKLEYATASLDEVRGHLSGWEKILSSRYHGSLAAAWSGSLVCIHERNHKLEGLRQELGLCACPNLSDPEALVRSLAHAAPARRELLEACQSRAERMIEELLNELS